MSRIAVYAGSFDPITRGHEDLIKRSLQFVDRIVVAVATNVSKQPLFTPGSSTGSSWTSRDPSGRI
jgi:cytidyltransferase-like protein